LENTEENWKKIGKILKKSKLNNEKYGRNQSWIVIRFGKFRRKLWNIFKSFHIQLTFLHIFNIISLFNWLFFHIFYIFSLFNLLFFIFSKFSTIQLTMNSEKIWKIQKKIIKR
jgi:hypothetical protein